MKDEEIQAAEGGVCAAEGFLAGGIHCGIRRNKSKRDLALIYSEVQANAAAVYTTNRVKGAPLLVTRRHLADGRAQAVLCNSGIANTCSAGGEEVAEKTCAYLAERLSISASDVAVASTGVIGRPLDPGPIRRGMPELVASLGKDCVPAAEAIMTTDTKVKQMAVSFPAGGKLCRIGGIAKGSGMIHPNMATMLVFLTTDCAVSSGMLRKALSADVRNTFNMVSVDGDTSTNDMVVLLANGMAGNPEITAEGPDFNVFMKALNTVAVALCKKIAGDGEGATKALECRVRGARDEETAKAAAKAVICSSLVKAAVFGADANWGRVLCAIGYGAAGADPSKAEIAFRSTAGEVTVCRNGTEADFSEDAAKKILTEDEVTICVDLHGGSARAAAWGCDLTYGYVKINSAYRT